MQYNTARFASRHAEYTDLYADKAETVWVAQVPNTCIIEAVRACRVYDALEADRRDQLGARVDLLARDVRRLTRRLGK